MNAALTNEDIARIDVGTLLQHTTSTRNGIPLPDARWGRPLRVTEIFGRGTTPDGAAFVCGYTEFGPHSQISFSTHAGEGMYRIVDGD